MTTSLKTLASAIVFGALALGGSTGAFAQAAVMKECGAEWQAAKAANKVQAGQTWNAFLADCRLRHAQLQPGPREAEMARGGLEGAQGIERQRRQGHAHAIRFSRDNGKD